MVQTESDQAQQTKKQKNSAKHQVHALPKAETLRIVVAIDPERGIIRFAFAPSAMTSLKATGFSRDGIQKSSEQRHAEPHQGLADVVHR
ncbi:MAG TPA: hypothetical protein VMF58_11835 [Rhizomicrobium sp.]|nr:hypothetical protein [Rhizomicrobium sp.]